MSSEIAAELVATKDALNAAYRERAHLVALLAAEYPSHIGHNDPFAPDWAVVTVELPTGQACWHISADDMDLFEHVPPTPHYVRGWDGHTTNEKYRRIRELAADTYTRRVAGTEAFLAAVERYEAEQPQDERDKRSLVERLSGDDAERVAALIDERDCWRKEVLELRAQVAAQAEQPQNDGDVRAVAPIVTVSGVCICDRCEVGQRAIYRMIGKCLNCKTDPILMLFRAGDEASSLKCPICECNRVYAYRRATDDEIPAATEEAALEAHDAKPAARERVAELAEHAEEER